MQEKFIPKSNVDFDSVEGKKIVRKVFTQLVAMNAHYSKKMNLDEWNFSKNAASHLKLDQVVVLDSIQYLVNCKCLTFITVKRNSPFLAGRNIKITHYGMQLWNHLNRARQSQPKPKKRNPYSKLFGYGTQQKKLTRDEVKQVAYKVTHASSLKELDPTQINKVLNYMKGRSTNHLKQLVAGNVS